MFVSYVLETPGNLVADHHLDIIVTACLHVFLLVRVCIMSSMAQ